MQELWKDVEGYEHAYQISNKGRLKTKARISKPYSDGRSNGHSIPERIRKPSIKNGYFFLWLYNKEGIRKMEYIHRLVAKHFVHEIRGTYVDHIDRNRQNNLFTNLRWTTQAKNCHNTNRKIKGYFFNKQQNKYQARIKINKKDYHLGFYENEMDARNAYLSAYQRKVLAHL